MIVINVIINVSTFAMNEVYCRVCIFVCYLRDGAKKLTLATKCTHDRSIPAVFGGGARQSVGCQVADCNGAMKKKTMKKRRKCPGTRYCSGQIRFLGLFVMLHLSPANGWPFKTPRCHFEHCRMPFFSLENGKDRS